MSTLGAIKSLKIHIMIPSQMPRARALLFFVLLFGAARSLLLPPSELPWSPCRSCSTVTLDSDSPLSAEIVSLSISLHHKFSFLSWLVLVVLWFGGHLSKDDHRAIAILRMEALKSKKTTPQILHVSLIHSRRCDNDIDSLIFVVFLELSFFSCFFFFRI